MKTAFIILFFIAAHCAFAQKVLLVDDDTYSKPDHYPRIKNAVALAISEKSGYELTEYIAGIDDALKLDQALSYNLIIWYCGNTGIGTHLWNENKTDNTLIPQLINEGVNLWIIGNDFLLDRYGNAPKEFVEGDFAYDILGVQTLVGESKKNDGDMGLPFIVSNTMSDLNIDTLKWDDNLWYADACVVRDGVQSIYTMAPDEYVFAGKSIMWVKSNPDKGNMIVSAFDPWFIDDSEKLHLFFSHFTEYQTTTSIKEQISTNAKIFPNPASDYIYCSNIPAPSTINVLITDILGNEFVQHIQVSDDNNWTVDIGMLPNGTYAIHANNRVFSVVICR